jgi:uncharacterized protein YcfL
MKKLSLILVSAALLVSCSSQKEKKEMKYSIHGNVEYRGQSRPAIWITDTFEVHHDTIVITNSDSSQWRIAPPYTVYVKD